MDSGFIRRRLKDLTKDKKDEQLDETSIDYAKKNEKKDVGKRILDKIEERRKHDGRKLVERKRDDKEPRTGTTELVQNADTQQDNEHKDNSLSKKRESFESND